MIVECGVCHRQYEDTRRFLNCPHNLTSILPTDTEDVTKEEAEYVSPYFHGKAPIVNMPPRFFEGADRVDWYHKAGDVYTPACPSFYAETAKMMNDANKRLMATPNFWNAPSSAGDITLEKLQAAYASASFGGQPIHVNPYIPKNELWMVSSKGDILKIVNIGNHPTPISDEDEPSLCRGESK